MMCILYTTTNCCTMEMSRHTVADTNKIQTARMRSTWKKECCTSRGCSQPSNSGTNRKKWEKPHWIYCIVTGQISINVYGHLCWTMDQLASHNVTGLLEGMCHTQADERKADRKHKVPVNICKLSQVLVWPRHPKWSRCHHRLSLQWCTENVEISSLWKA